MPSECSKINVQVLLSELKACTKARNLERGRQLHADAAESEHSSSAYVASALINMYAKCGSMVDARQVFESMKHPDVVSWNALTLGYAENGQGFVALKLFRTMRLEGPEPNSVSFIAILKACTSLAAEETGELAECRGWGKAIFNISVENGCNDDVYVQGVLMNLYARCGGMVDAHQVFDSMKHRDVVLWNTLILGYAENGQGLTALDLFAKMKTRGILPSSVTFLAVLKACSSFALKDDANGWAECWNRGKQVHILAVEHDCNADVSVQNTLIDMYSRSRSMLDARQVLDSMKDPNVVSWTALILGYADTGESLTALNLFKKMRKQGPAPNSVTLSSVLQACTALGCRERSKALHNVAVQLGCNSNVYVQSGLIDMYCKCSSMVEARQVFDDSKKDVASWNALIQGYADTGDALTALNLLTRMRNGGPAPNSVTFLTALKACGLVGALELGRKVHAEMDKIELKAALVSSLVDFYAKCGSLREAQQVFDLHHGKTNVVSWTALLAGFSSSGDHAHVFELFQGMQDAGFQPSAVTFVAMLMCCSHAGLVAKGRECFEAMSSKFGVVPTVEHYTCMVDLFGRANELDEAMALLGSMPCTPDCVLWRTLLAACRKWKNVEIARLAFVSLLHLNEAENASAYVVMGQIFGSRGMLRQQRMVMGMGSELLEGCYKTSGQACWTSELGQVHVFADRYPRGLTKLTMSLGHNVV